MLWNYITQADAASAARAMYAENGNFASDLVNSYAWDTAIVFIQTYSEETDYSKQNSKNTGRPANTGERSETTDKVCNIYDIASNTREWTTETSSYTNAPCVNDGGGYYNSSTYANARGSHSEANKYVSVSFRVTLYIQ